MNTDQKKIETVENEKIDKVVLDKNLDNYFKNSMTENSSFKLNRDTPKTPILVQDKKVRFTSGFIGIFKFKILEESKRPSSKMRKNSSSKRPEYAGRDDKVESDIFYKVKDENEHLKKHQTKLNEDIKRLNTALERVKYDVLMERRLSDRKVIQIDGGFDVEVETMKLENDKLKDKVTKMTTIIHGLQSAQKSKSLNPRKSLINAKSTLENQSDKNEYLKLIHLLREQLKTSEYEVKRLHTEMFGPNKNMKNMTEYTKDVRYFLTLIAKGKKRPARRGSDKIREDAVTIRD